MKMKHNHRVQFIVQLQTPGTLQGSILSYLSISKTKLIIFNKELYHPYHPLWFALCYLTHKVQDGEGLEGLELRRNS